MVTVRRTSTRCRDIKLQDRLLTRHQHIKAFILNLVEARDNCRRRHLCGGFVVAHDGPDVALLLVTATARVLRHDPKEIVGCIILIDIGNNVGPLTVGYE